MGISTSIQSFMWKSGKLEVSWGFGAMLLLALLAGAGSVLPLVALSALCHELGHLACLRLTGAPVESLRLTAFGAEICARTRRLSYGQEILCTLAGPLVNLGLALVFSRITGDYLLAGANLILGCFNLLPIPSLDGGRVLHLLVSWCTDPLLADRICARIGVGCSVLLTALAFVLTVWQGAGLFLLLGAFGTLLPQIPRKTGSIVS